MAPLWISPLLLVGLTAWALERPAPEFQAKLELMGKATRFVDWPPQSPLRTSRSAFVLGILGRSPFGDELDQHFQRQPLKGKPVQIRYCRSLEDAETCDLLFICDSEKERLPAILNHLHLRPVLTVADAPGFVQSGVMVGILKEAEKLIFAVNLSAAREGHFRFAPGFLQIVHIVSP